MGLDTVELVMDVEESFGIKIPDDEAQKIITVGDLFEFVKSRMEMAPVGTCLTAATFYEIRRGFQDSGIQARFAPSTAICEIAPDRNRRSFWSKLANRTQLRFPDLVRPSWIVNLNILITFSASILTAIIASGRDTSGTIFVITMVAGFFFFGWVMAVATQPFATQFPADFKTFRGLSERVLALNATNLKKKHGAMGSNDIWIVLRELIVNQLGVDADEVTPTANFIKDLGCG